jgi:ankyrin repeat protein
MKISVPVDRINKKYRASPELLYACEIGDLELVKSLLNGKIDASAVNVAAKYGHLDIIKYIIESQIEVLWDAPSAHIYSHNQGNILVWEYALIYAAEGGQMNILRYLVESDVPIRNYAIKTALVNGHLEVAKYLQKKSGVEINEITNISEAFGEAIVNNRLDIVKYLVKSGLPPSDFKVNLAISYGHYEIADYLLVNYITEKSNQDIKERLKIIKSMRDYEIRKVVKQNLNLDNITSTKISKQLSDFLFGKRYKKSKKSRKSRKRVKRVKRVKEHKNVVAGFDT